MLMVTETSISMFYLQKILFVVFWKYGNVPTWLHLASGYSRFWGIYDSWERIHPDKSFSLTLNSLLI